MIIHRLLCMIGIHHYTRIVHVLSWHPIETGEMYEKCDVCERKRR